MRRKSLVGRKDVEENGFIRESVMGRNGGMGGRSVCIVGGTVGMGKRVIRK